MTRRLMTGGRRWKSTQVKGERPRPSQGSPGRHQENFDRFTRCLWGESHGFFYSAHLALLEQQSKSRQVPFLGIFRVKVHSSASIFSSKVIEWIHTTWIPVDCAWNGLQFFYLELFDWTKRLTVNSRNIFHDHQTFSSFCGRTFDYIGLNWKDDL